MQQAELIPHLFRTEFRKITAVLCKLFGPEHLQIAEDLAGETFLAALETWTYKGIPEQPTAWLYTVARNKARNYRQRNQLFREKISPRLRNAPAHEEMTVDLSEQNIRDSQLQMLFVLSHPALSAQTQVALSLRILCGFGIEEIANAFLTNKEMISKRLQRGKDKLRSLELKIDFPAPSQIPERLAAVLKTIYLLFSEGYYSECHDAVLREDLCLEAMRLTSILLEYAPTARPKVHALMALMCFHASRFPARKDAAGELILYADQDRQLWNEELIARGAGHLHRASTGSEVSSYHLQAAIAYWNTIEDSAEKWENILRLYDHLLLVEDSPVAALNRAYALSRVRGKIAAIAEAEKLDLQGNPFYHALLGELFSGIDPAKSVAHLQKACSLARTAGDRNLLRKKLEKAV